MPLPGRFESVALWLLLLPLLAALGCETTGESSSRVSAPRRASDVAAARLDPEQDGAPKPPADVPVRLVGPTETQPAPSVERLKQQVPDPPMAIDLARREIERLEKELAKPDFSKDSLQEYNRRKKFYPRLTERLNAIQRPKLVQLSLKDVIRRTLQNSYPIQVHAYKPAIDAARVVEAEATFDAVFFTSFTNDKQNRPSSSQLTGTNTQNRVFEGGIRKLLSAGTQVQASYALTRTETDLVFQTLNPSYFNQFIVEFRQPFLKGFGLDFNRSQIELRRLDRRMSTERLEKEIRETLFNVEQAYWRLAQARRALAVSARLLQDLEILQEVVRGRSTAETGDILPSEASLVESSVEQRNAEFVRRRADVMNAEDAIKSLMNDPVLNFAQPDVEIVPTEPASFHPFELDVLGEVTAALNYRSELHEARLAIEQAQIGIGVAKNQALPKLDVMFRYVVDGLGKNPDRAFSQLSENDFNEYLIQVQFEWPIGARGGEAVLRQARLKQAQAIAAHRGQIESVILDVQKAVRDLVTSYDQVAPNLRAAEASAKQLWVTQQRRPALNLPNLQVELNANETLANSRYALVQALADYNIALINLERQKGTLLQYNNVVLRGLDENAYPETHRTTAR